MSEDEIEAPATSQPGLSQPDDDPAADALPSAPDMEPEADDELGHSLPPPTEATVESPRFDVSRAHLKGLLEALIFASDRPQKSNDLAKVASAGLKDVRELLHELRKEYEARGIQFGEVAGGWVFRTNPIYAPFVRDLTKQKPVRLTRAQVETLAIVAYRQPVTRPEVDDIRGVDSGPVLKLLLERDLVRILGKRDEPGRPMIYGTTTAFLEFFGLKSLKDLPTLREFTELSEDSRRVAERELGEDLEGGAPRGDAAVDATYAQPIVSEDATVAQPDVVTEVTGDVQDVTPPSE
jgi:segregation and condensation protein B